MNLCDCLNGVCSSGCDLEKENACPEEQQCADLGIDLGGGGGGFFGGGDADAMIGVCMRPCTDTSCGELSRSIAASSERDGCGTEMGIVRVVRVSGIRVERKWVSAVSV